ncbi:MAG: alginate export family protein, partial [Sphingobium sp.]
MIFLSAARPRALLTLTTGIGAIIMAAPAQADELPTLQKAIGNPGDFSLSGATRLRYEALGGQARAGFGESEDLVSLRTIITAEYRTGALKFGAELHDARVFGIEPGSVVTANEVNTVELVQAHATLALPGLLGKGSKTTVQAGRMTLNIGSRRLIAADDYRNTTNGYTGIRADMKIADGTAATILYMLPQIRLPEDAASIRRGKIQMDRENFDTQLWGAFLTRPRLVGRTMGEIAYVGFAEKDAPGRPSRDRRLSNISARLISDPMPGKWDFEAEAIHQFGTVSTGTAATAPRQRVAAWLLHGDVGYSFPGAWKARLSIEYDLAGGDGPGGTNGRFDTLYGMRRADFVPSGIYSAIGRTNISTPGVRIEVAPGKRLDAYASYHPLWLANRFDSFSTTGV